jgi:N4-gp56 family major capsid protein
MAVTVPANVDTSIPELWAKAVLRESLAGGFWKNMTGGEGSGQPIIQKSELLNNPGDTIHIQTTEPLSEAGISGDTAMLVGNEEALATSEMVVIPTLYRHAVRVNRRANKKSIVDLRGEAKMRLAEWGEQKMDSLRFTNFTSVGPTINGDTYVPNLYIVGGGTDEDDVGLGDTLTVEAMQQIKLELVNQLAKPIRFDGLPFYAMVVHPNTMYDLKREDEYRDWVREAERRGPDNPFFKGATAVIDGMTIFEHPNIDNSDNAGSVAVSRGIAFGSEFAVEGLDENVSWAEDEFDYGLEFGIAFSFAFQPRRALELNSIGVLCAAEAPTP